MDFDYVVMPAILLTAGIFILWLSIRRMRSLSAKSYRTRRKVGERIVLSTVAVLAAAVAGSSLFNAIALHHFRVLNPVPGENYTVSGHTMHIHCMGSGSPTIVLDAGLGNDSLIWGAMQPVLSKTTRVCSYDRSGFGLSDARPAPRDANHIAGELHQLLFEAKVTGPLVLMGHSISGMYMRDYATHYLPDVAGIVFVDSSTPLQDENPTMTAKKGYAPPQWVSMLFQRAALITGVPRLLGMCSQAPSGFEAQAGKLQAEDVCQLHLSALAAEIDSFNQSGRQTAHTGPYGTLPILIFSHDPARVLPKQNPAQQDVARENAWSRMQEDLKKLSTRSRRIIAKGSTHYVQLDRANLVEREVLLFIDQIRGTASQPTNYGSTITE